MRVERGAFEMGSAHGGKANERPAHKVTISKPFCMAAYEITVGQWNAVMGDGRAVRTGERSLPKTSVSWDEAEDFVQRLEAKNPGRHFFLPSEAQWEYAGRADSAERYSFGGDPAELHLYANCLSREGHENGYSGLAPIGKFLPNKWYLWDMQGNVSEWVADRYGGYDPAPAVDPVGPAEGDQRIHRGGSWKSSPVTCSVAHRGGLAPGFRRDDLGFRIAAEPVR